MAWILYVHILSACAWIGGSILLFGLGIFLRDPETQEKVYGAIGPFYGYFESAWLIVLLVSGYFLAEMHGLFSMIGDTGSELGRYVNAKVFMSFLLVVATAVHLYIAFATHQKMRTPLQHLLSRGGSLAIFLLNLGILAAAVLIRTIL